MYGRGGEVAAGGAAGMMVFDRVDPAYTTKTGCRLVWRVGASGGSRGSGGDLLDERAVVLGGSELAALVDLLKRDAVGDIDLEDHASKVIVNSDVTQFSLRDGLFEADTSELRRRILEYAQVEHEPLRLDVKSKEFYPSSPWASAGGSGGGSAPQQPAPQQPAPQQPAPQQPAPQQPAPQQPAPQQPAPQQPAPQQPAPQQPAPQQPRTRPAAGRPDLALHQAILSASSGMVGTAPAPPGSGTGQEAGPPRDLFRVMARRRSTRRFAPVKVDDWMVDKILAAADTAPTAGNFQGFRVFYVRNRQAKEALVEAANNQPYVNAPVVLVFCMEPSRVQMKFEPRTLEKFSLQDATLAAAYSQLAASALGLSSIWIGMLDEQKVMDVLGTDLRPSSILCIGHPAKYRPPKARRHLRDLIRVIE